MKSEGLIWQKRKNKPFLNALPEDSVRESDPYRNRLEFTPNRMDMVTIILGIVIFNQKVLTLNTVIVI